MEGIKRKIYIFLLLIGLVPVIFSTGCAKKEERAEVVKLRFGYWGLAEEQATTRKVVNLFNRDHPNIEVKFEHIFGRHYLRKVLTEVAGGNAPDIFGVDSTMTVFMRKGALLSLETFLKEDKEISISDYYPQVVEPLRYKGGLYALPNEFSTVVLFYNKALFDEVGLSYPDETWDWDTFLWAAKGLTKRDESGRATQFGVIFHIALPKPGE